MCVVSQGLVPVRTRSRSPEAGRRTGSVRLGGPWKRSLDLRLALEEYVEDGRCDVAAGFVGGHADIRTHELQRSQSQGFHCCHEDPELDHGHGPEKGDLAELAPLLHPDGDRSHDEHEETHEENQEQEHPPERHHPPEVSPSSQEGLSARASGARDTGSHTIILECWGARSLALAG